VKYYYFYFMCSFNILYLKELSLILIFILKYASCFLIFIYIFLIPLKFLFFLVFFLFKMDFSLKPMHELRKFQKMVIIKFRLCFFQSIDLEAQYYSKFNFSTQNFWYLIYINFFLFYLEQKCSSYLYFHNSL
jgi:hypothetical protein